MSNNADTDLYVRMPTNKHSAETKLEVPHKEEDAFQEPITPMKDTGFHTDMGWYVSLIESYTILVCQIWNAAG